MPHHCHALILYFIFLFQRVKIFLEEKNLLDWVCFNPAGTEFMIQCQHASALTLDTKALPTSGCSEWPCALICSLLVEEFALWGSIKYHINIPYPLPCTNLCCKSLRSLCKHQKHTVKCWRFHEEWGLLDIGQKKAYTEEAESHMFYSNCTSVMYLKYFIV